MPYLTDFFIHISMYLFTRLDRTQKSTCRCRPTIYANALRNRRPIRTRPNKLQFIALDHTQSHSHKIDLRLKTDSLYVIYSLNKLCIRLCFVESMINSFTLVLLDWPFYGRGRQTTMSITGRGRRRTLLS